MTENTEDRFQIRGTGAEATGYPSTMIAANLDRRAELPILSIGRDATYDFGFRKSDLNEIDPPMYSFLWDMKEPTKIADSLASWIKWTERA